MKKSSKIISLSVLLSISMTSLTGINKSFQSVSYAQTELNLGIDTSNFKNMSVEAKLDQDEENKNESINSLRKIRAMAWDEDWPFTTSDSNPNKQTIRSYAKSLGIDTKEEYLDSISYSNDLEKISIQRAFEQFITGLSHARPDDSSCFSAVLSNGVESYAENLAWSWGQMTPESVINQWSLDKDSSGKSELEFLIEAQGVSNSENGHLHSFLNPEYKSFGLAIAENEKGHYGVAQLSYDEFSDNQATGLVGTYTINFGDSKVSKSDDSDKKDKKYDKDFLRKDLKRAIKRNEIQIAAAQYLIDELPDLVGDHRPELEDLINHSKKLLKTAYSMLDSL